MIAVILRVFALLTVPILTIATLTISLWTAPALAEAPEPTDHLHPRWHNSAPPTTLEVYLSPEGHRGFLSYLRPDHTRWTSQIFPMWKARVADLNGDGQDLLVLGIWSTVRRHDEPSPHRAVWVMAYRDGRLVPVWQGSGLTHPLRDFDVADLTGDGRHELLTIESVDDQCSWSIYSFHGFGFYGLARGPLSCDATFSPEPGCFTLEEELFCPTPSTDDSDAALPSDAHPPRATPDRPPTPDSPPESRVPPDQ